MPIVPFAVYNDGDSVATMGGRVRIEINYTPALTNVNTAPQTILAVETQDVMGCDVSTIQRALDDARCQWKMLTGTDPTDSSGNPVTPNCVREPQRDINYAVIKDSGGQVAKGICSAECTNVPGSTSCMSLTLDVPAYAPWGLYSDTYITASDLCNKLRNNEGNGTMKDLESKINVYNSNVGTMACEWDPASGAVFICQPDPNNPPPAGEPQCYTKDGSCALDFAYSTVVPASFDPTISNDPLYSAYQSIMNLNTCSVPRGSAYTLPMGMDVLSAFYSSIYYFNSNDNPNPTPRGLAVVGWECVIHPANPGKCSCVDDSTVSSGSTPAPAASPELCSNTARKAMTVPSVYIKLTNDKPRLKQSLDCTVDPTGCTTAEYVMSLPTDDTKPNPPATGTPTIQSFNTSNTADGVELTLLYQEQASPLLVFADTDVSMVDSDYVYWVRTVMTDATQGQDELGCYYGGTFGVTDFCLTANGDIVTAWKAGDAGAPAGCDTANGQVHGVCAVQPFCGKDANATVDCADGETHSTCMYFYDANDSTSCNATSTRGSIFVNIMRAGQLAPTAWDSTPGLTASQATSILHTLAYYNPGNSSTCYTDLNGTKLQRRLRVVVTDETYNLMNSTPFSNWFTPGPNPTPASTGPGSDLVTEGSQWQAGLDSNPTFRSLMLLNKDNDMSFSDPSTPDSPGTDATGSPGFSSSNPLQRVWVEVNGPQPQTNANLPNELYNGMIYLLPNATVSDLDGTLYQSARFEFTSNFHRRQVSLQNCDSTCPNTGTNDPCNCGGFTGPIEDEIFCNWDEYTTLKSSPTQLLSKYNMTPDDVDALMSRVDCKWRFDDNTNSVLLDNGTVASGGTPNANLLIRGVVDATTGDRYLLSQTDLTRTLRIVAYKNNFAYPHPTKYDTTNNVYTSEGMHTVTVTITDQGDLTPKGGTGPGVECGQWLPCTTNCGSDNISKVKKLYLEVAVQPGLEDALLLENMQWGPCSAAPDCVQTRNPICQSHQWAWGVARKTDTTGHTSLGNMTMTLTDGTVLTVEQVNFTPMFHSDGTPYVQPITFCGAMSTISQTCSFVDCPRFQWVTSAWSSCDATTCNSTQQRSAFCKAVGLPFYITPSSDNCVSPPTGTDLVQLSPSDWTTNNYCTCKQSSVPTLVQQCPSTDCSGTRLVEGILSACTKTCSTKDSNGNYQGGNQSRVLKCMQSGTVSTDFATCIQSAALPDNSTWTCVVGANSVKTCSSSTSGSGTRTATELQNGCRQCSVSTDGKTCTETLLNSCGMTPCPTPFYVPQAWGACSVPNPAPANNPCAGTRTRTNYCMMPTAYGLVPTSDSDCGTDSSPPTSQACISTSCNCDADTTAKLDMTSGEFANGTCLGSAVTCDKGYILVKGDNGLLSCVADQLQCPQGQMSYYGKATDDAADKWRCCGGLDVTGLCCAQGAPSMIDPTTKNSVCCQVGEILDECGTCHNPNNGPGGVWSAADNKCCTDGEISVDGHCCAGTSKRDDCGVCGGSNSCLVQVSGVAGVVGTPQAVTGRRALQQSSDAQSIASAVASILGISTSRVVVTSTSDTTLSSTSGNRRLQQSGAVNTVAFTLQIKAASAVGDVPTVSSVQAALSGNSGTSSVLFGSVSSSPQGIAGNMLCEVGESYSTVPGDCPTPPTTQVCETPSSGVGNVLAMCAGNGSCVQGACQCKPGYTGTGCNMCAPGYQQSGQFCVGSSASTASTSGSSPSSPGAATPAAGTTPAAGKSTGGATTPAPATGSGSAAAAPGSSSGSSSPGVSGNAGSGAPAPSSSAPPTQNSGNMSTGTSTASGGSSSAAGTVGVASASGGSNVAIIAGFAGAGVAVVGIGAFAVYSIKRNRTEAATVAVAPLEEVVQTSEPSAEAVASKDTSVTSKMASAKVAPSPPGTSAGRTTEAVAPVDDVVIS